MKKKNVKKTVSVSLAGAILMSSCSPQNIIEYEELERNNATTKNAPKHSKQSSEDWLSSCIIPLSEEDKQLINLCINLMDDILKNKEVAEQFSKNPQLYFEERGYTYVGELDSGLIQLALAAADEDIRHSIEMQDAKLFVNLCIQKGLLSIPSNLDITQSINGQITDKEQLKNFLSLHGYDLLDDDNSSLRDNNAEVAVEAVTLLYVAGIVVVAALVAVGAFIVACVEGGEVPKPMEPIKPTNLEISPLSLWLFNNSASSIDAPINTWVETQYKLIDDILMENCPNYVSNTTYREQLRKIILANLWSYIL